MFFDELGVNCIFESNLILIKKGQLKIGNNVHFCQNSQIIIAKNAELIIGNNVFLGFGIKISCHEKIVIGDDSQVGEYVCIHDNNHLYNDLDTPIRRQGFETEITKIGNDCWIGSHCTILKGSELSNQSILGANSVLNKKLPERIIAGGVPAKIIKERM